MRAAPDLSFAGRTVVVTGAGRGIGRAYAIEIARRGGCVAVNDISEAPATAVVDEIRSAGGRAQAVIANIADPEQCAELISRTCEAFGGVDAIAANASINGKRRAFADLAIGDLRDMLEVNVIGAWSLLQAAWPHLSANGRGRVLLTTSQAALYGMPMLAEYAVAKASMIGLLRVLAQEGAGVGVKLNAIAPAAATRMTEETIKDAATLGLLRDLQPPELVAPVAAALLHESCALSGEIFVAGGAHVGRVFIGETPGLTLPWDDFTAEAVHAQFAAVCDESGYRVPRDISETGDPQQKAEIFRRLREIGFVSSQRERQ